MFNIFNIFKRKNNDDESLIASYKLGQFLKDNAAKVKSLEQLDRHEEAQEIIDVTNRLIRKNIDSNKVNKFGYIHIAEYFLIVRKYNESELIINSALSSDWLNLDEEELLYLESILNKIKIEQSLSDVTNSGSKHYTQVYCCQNCGRLINFITMPCPHCNWSPTTIELMAQSMVLTFPYFKIPALLMISREFKNKRPATDIVLNLNQQAEKILSDIRPSVVKLLNLLNKTEHKNHRKISVIRHCLECGKNIFFSNADTCHNCGEPVNWPEIVRLMVCIDNLLFLFENRIEVSDSEHESELVCVMVAMLNDLLRNQVVPNEQNRQYALHSLKSMKVICDKNKGFVVDLKDIHNLNAYLIKDDMLPDTEGYAKFWINEIPVFVNMMTNGIRL